MLDLSQVNGKKVIEMLVGTLGIYATYLLSGIFHEYIRIKLKYYDDVTGELSGYQWPLGFLIFPCAVTWLTGWAVNSLTIPETEATHIPMGKSITCAITVFISTITYTYAIYWTTFPVVMMFKSCNILSVILVGVLCSRVKEKKLQLGGKKIVVGILVTVGIVLFKYYDYETSSKEEKTTQILGLLLLFISLLADGFLPDFQAEIKSVYKPQPMEMMEQINKWVCLLSLAVGIVVGDFYQIILFMMTHFKFIVHMAAMGILSTLGQMFVYRMIKEFKQHIVPFVITTRKIITVGLSILYFGHTTNYQQILGILLVFGIVTYEFVSELSDSHPGSHQQSHNSFPASNDLEIETPSQEISLETNQEAAQRHANK